MNNLKRHAPLLSRLPEAEMQRLMMSRTTRSRACMVGDVFERPAVNTSMWAWGPRPCGPQSLKDIADHAGLTACANRPDSRNHAHRGGVT